MKGLGRILLINLGILVVLAGAAAIGYWYWYQGYTYVSTNNAAISAPIAEVAAPTAGELTGWHLQMGQSVTAGEQLGTIKKASGGSGPASLPVTSTVAGSIGQVDAANDSMIGPGTPLASVVETSGLFVTANVAETTISKVKPGQTVDITLPAFPSDTFHGKVAEIDPATAGTFSLLPQTNTTTNYTPVTQVVPVRIDFVDPPQSLGYALRPGETASVRIHVH